MTDENHETSGFISQPSNDIGSEPQLRTTTYHATPPRSTPFSFSRSRKWLVVGFILAAILFLVVVVTLVIALAAQAKLSNQVNNLQDPNADPFQSPCNEQNDSVSLEMDATSIFHKSCSDHVNVIQGCDLLGETSWRLLPATGYTSLISLLPLSHRNATTQLLFSPLFHPSSATSCTVQASFNLSFAQHAANLIDVSDNKFYTFLVTSENASLLSTATSQGCSRLTFDNAGVTPFRLAIVSRQKMIVTNNASISLTSQPCWTFKTVALESKTTDTFSIVAPGKRNNCTSEIFQRTRVECDWTNVTTADSGSFKRVQSHSCVAAGVNHVRRQSWFLSLEGSAGTRSRAIFVSPVVDRGTSRLLFSLWYMLQCGGPFLRAYVVPYDGRGTSGVFSQSFEKLEIRNTKPQKIWQFEMFQINLPARHQFYQVVDDAAHMDVHKTLYPFNTTKKMPQVILEAVIPAVVNCTGHNCFSVRSSVVNKVKSPLIAVDDIVLETLHDSCSTSTPLDLNGTVRINLNCSFQSAAGKTYCKWKSSGDEQNPNSIFDFGDYYNDWKLHNSTLYEDNGHGASKNHFEGRGYILSIDASGNSGVEMYIRTPLLTAGSNCSCEMTFLYLLRGRFAPRLQVNFIVGSDATNPRRPMLLQWTLHGHQSEDWQTARVMLNLNVNVVFEIEIRVTDIEESRGDVSIDDVAFHRCDLHAYGG